MLNVEQRYRLIYKPAVFSASLTPAVLLTAGAFGIGDLGPDPTAHILHTCGKTTLNFLLLTLLVTPVAPHMLFDRTLVLDATESVRVEVVDTRAATLSVDGRDVGVLSGGDAIVCTAGAHAARLVTFGDRDFHDILKAKFGLADR